MKKFFALLLIALMTLTLTTAFAEEAPAVAAAADEGSVTSVKAIAAAVTIAIAAGAGAIAMSSAIGKSAEGVSRQPEAASSISGSLTLGLVFIETCIIYALIVAILIVFVL